MYYLYYIFLCDIFNFRGQHLQVSLTLADLHSLVQRGASACLRIWESAKERMRWWQHDNLQTYFFRHLFLRRQNASSWLDCLRWKGQYCSTTQEEQEHLPVGFVTVELGIGQLLQIRKVESGRSNSRSSSVIVFPPPVLGSGLFSLLLGSLFLNQTTSSEAEQGTG